MTDRVQVDAAGPRVSGEPLGPGPTGVAPMTYSLSAIVISGLLIVVCVFFLLPLGIMLLASLKPADEVGIGSVFSLPVNWTAFL